MHARIQSQRYSTRLAAWLADELQPAQLLRSLIAGLLNYTIEAILVISFAALIFSNQPADQLIYGIGWFLAGDLVLVLVVTLLSSSPSTLAVIQDAPTAILMPAVASVSAIVAAQAGPAGALPTIAALIAITALTTGLGFLLVGYFRLGGLARFLPYPVMGGFLAGTGWLLAIGGIGMMADQPLGFALLDSGMLLRWVPGVLLGALLLYATNRLQSPLALPGILLGAVLLFYGVGWASSVTLAQLSAQGWLIGPFPSSSLWRFPLNPEWLGQVRWDVIGDHAGYLAPILIVSMLALLLNASGIELITKRDIDLNRELVAAGWANLLGGLVGCSVGYQAIGTTSLNHTTAGPRHLPGLLMAAGLGLTVLFGAVVLSYFPKLILGGLLVFLGLDLLMEWIYRAWFKFAKLEFAIIVCIAAVIAVRSFLEGIAVGLVAAIGLFVVSYSRVDVVKHALSGAAYHSRVTRSYQHHQLLIKQGDQIAIFQLQGFVFFGTAMRLLDRIRQRMRDNSATRLRFVALDFAQVSGIDSTALLSFSRLIDLAHEQGVVLLLTGLAPTIQHQIGAHSLAAQSEVVRIFPSLDYGVEWCENELIAAALLDESSDRSLLDQLAQIVPAPGELNTLLSFCTRRELAPGEYLIRQGDSTDTIFFIEHGQVTARLESAGRAPVRLETMRGGRTVGELGFYLGTRRSAAVVVDESSVVYCLSKQDLARIERDEPATAYTFHRIVVHLLGERVIHLTRAVDALQK